MGRDAITTGTICIFFLYFKYLMDSFFKRKFIKEKYDYWIYLLIALGASSIILPYLAGIMEPAQIGKAARHFFAFLGAILLFIVIKNSQKETVSSNSKFYIDHIEKLLSLIILLISFNIIIAIAIKFFPSLESVFKVFLPRHANISDIAVGQEEVKRIRSFVIGYEELGEILATLTPILLYKIFRFRNPAWLICLLLFFMGEVLAVTRSGIILFAIAIAFFILYYSKKNFGTAMAFACSLSTAFFIALYFVPSLFGDIILRFNVSAEIYESGGTLIEIINRKGVFIPAWDTVTKNLSFFGNGVSDFNFHNLILTTLHEKGIIGAILFFIILLYPLFHLIRSFKNDLSINKTLIFSCLLSMALFLINEIKFEFTRAGSYQQICWGIIATYYLIPKASLRKKIYENKNK